MALSLESLIEMLTREHLRMSGDRMVKAPALLDELDAAVSGSGVKNGDSGGGSNRSPINVSAFDLRADIHAQAYTWWNEHAGYWHNGSARDAIADVMKMQLTPEQRGSYERVMLEWCDRIEDELGRNAPVRKLTGAECPACGLAVYDDERKPTIAVHCYGDDGYMIPLADWWAECKACQAQWRGENFQFILPYLRVSEDVIEDGNMVS